ncbi:MAG: class I SAM-dependent methyltransferase [Phycisphaeraceae bacterium]
MTRQTAASQAATTVAGSGPVGDDLEHVPCPVCGGDKPSFVLEAAEFRSAVGRRFRVVRCGSCDHMYTSPRPTLDAIGRYYPDQYYDALEAQPTGKAPLKRHKGLRERLARYALRQHLGYPGNTPRTLVRRLLSWPIAWWLRHGRRTVDAIPWSGRGELCDFGCGGCGFLRLQRRRGWNVCGIDFNAKVAEWAKERDDLDVAVGTWPGEALAGRTFDAITAWHAIEHLPDPVGWVKAAADRLNRGGYLLVCCPDADSWAFRTFGGDWNGLKLPRHFSHFTKQKLAQVISEAGLVVERFRPQVRPTTLKGSAEIRAKRTGSAFWKCVSASSIFWRPVARVTGWFRCADGMTVIARKPAG